MKRLLALVLGPAMALGLVLTAATAPAASAYGWGYCTSYKGSTIRALCTNGMKSWPGHYQLVGIVNPYSYPVRYYEWDNANVIGTMCIPSKGTRWIDGGTTMVSPVVNVSQYGGGAERCTL